MRYATLVLNLICILSMLACTRRSPSAAFSATQSNQTNQRSEQSTLVAPPSNNSTVRSSSNSTNPPNSPPAVTLVPARYQSLYSELDAALEAFDKSFDAPGAQSPVMFGAELLPANGNRGTELLNPQTMAGVRVNLDALLKVGVRGVTVAIKYPMLTPDFPNSSHYLELFKNVSSEIHRREMKLDVEVGMIFPPPFSSLNLNYKGLTFDEYKRKNRQMVETIIQEVKPDYLNLGSEPDTEARISGLRELNTPQGYTDLINYTLKDLNRGNTLIGAGSGTWAPFDFVKSETENTSLDFISLHVYPVTNQGLQKAVTMADFAHQSGKRVIMDEMWLYKSGASEPATSIAGNSEIFRRDVYSFWQPLDQKFLGVIAKIARAKNIEYVSAFWAAEFFGYLDYDPKWDALDYKDLNAQFTAQVSRNLLTGSASPTGEFYSRLTIGAK